MEELDKIYFQVDEDGQLDCWRECDCGLTGVIEHVQEDVDVLNKWLYENRYEFAKFYKDEFDKEYGCECVDDGKVEVDMNSLNNNNLDEIKEVIKRLMYKELGIKNEYKDLIDLGWKLVISLRKENEHEFRKGGAVIILNSEGYVYHNGKDFVYQSKTYKHCSSGDVLSDKLVKAIELERNKYRWY